MIYPRLHGSEELYASGYSDKALDRWAARIRKWAAGSEPADANRIDGKARARKSSGRVHVYFDNDAKVRARFDASGLMERLGLEPSG